MTPAAKKVFEQATDNLATKLMRIDMLGVPIPTWLDKQWYSNYYKVWRNECRK